MKDLAGYGVDLLWGLGPLALGIAIAGLLPSRSKEPMERPPAGGISRSRQRFRSRPSPASSGARGSSRRRFPPMRRAGHGRCRRSGRGSAGGGARRCFSRSSCWSGGSSSAWRRGTRSGVFRRFPGPPRLSSGRRSDPGGACGLDDVPDLGGMAPRSARAPSPLWRRRARGRGHPVAGIYLSPGARARRRADGEARVVRGRRPRADSRIFGLPAGAGLLHRLPSAPNELLARRAPGRGATSSGLLDRLQSC